jgi:hypothetical protein
MAYITTAEVKIIRNDLKAKYPAKKGWKFSVRQKDHSSLHVDILQAPLQMIEEGTKKTINHHWLDDVDVSEESLSIIKDIVEISNKTNFDKSDIQSDYFNVGYYFNMNIGNWDKPFHYAEGYSIEDKLEMLGL